MNPNIVCILIDTLRADHLSLYGYNRSTSPFLDSLADGGVVYERAYSNSIWTLPSYISLFTGRYPSQHGIVDWGKRLESNSLVNELEQYGYDTFAASSHALTGKYGMANAFDEVRWIPVSSRDLLFTPDPVFEELDAKRARGEYDSPREKYVDAIQTSILRKSPKTLANGAYHVVQELKEKYGYWTDDGAREIVDAGLDLVATSDDPFFLFMNFIEPHAPYRPPRDSIYEFLPEDVSIGEINGAIKWFLEVTLEKDEITPDERQILIDLYDAEIRYLDDQLRRFYESLPDEVRDDTVFVICADHGDLFGEWGIWGHQGKIHNSLSRIPLLVSSPWSSAARITEPVELRGLHDFFHQLASGSGETATIQSTGEALIEYYGLDTQLGFKPWDTYDGVEADDWNRYQVSLVTEDRRLWWEAGHEAELYDPETDPEERSDLSDSEPEVVRQLQERVRELVGEPMSLHRQYRASADDEIEMDNETMQHLENLGYM